MRMRLYWLLVRVQGGHAYGLIWGWQVKRNVVRKYTRTRMCTIVLTTSSHSFFSVRWLGQMKSIARARASGNGEAIYAAINTAVFFQRVRKVWDITHSISLEVLVEAAVAAQSASINLSPKNLLNSSQSHSIGGL